MATRIVSVYMVHVIMFPRGSASVYTVHVIKISIGNYFAKPRRSFFEFCVYTVCNVRSHAAHSISTNITETS